MRKLLYLVELHVITVRLCYGRVLCQDGKEISCSVILPVCPSSSFSPCIPIRNTKQSNIPRKNKSSGICTPDSDHVYRDRSSCVALGLCKVDPRPRAKILRQLPSRLFLGLDGIGEIFPRSKSSSPSPPMSRGISSAGVRGSSFTWI